jgi:hypothetical protein
LGPAPPALVVHDTFDEANQVLLQTHTPAPINTPGGKWTVTVGTLAVQLGKVIGGIGTNTAYLPTGLVDLDVAIVFYLSSANDDVRLLVRLVDGDNYIFGYVSPTLFMLASRLATVETAIASVQYSAPLNTTMLLRCKVQGSDFLLTLETPQGQVVQTIWAQDSSLSSASAAGLGIGLTAAPGPVITDFVVTPAS